MMSWSTVRIACGLLVWGGCLIGSLSISQLTGELGHTICGPWGCGPPLEALIAIHLAWIVVLTPAVAWAVWSGYFSAPAIVRMGQVLAGVGMAGLFGILAYQLLVWLPQAGDWQRAYLPQRYGFVVATSVDFPVVQFLLIGCSLWAVARRKTPVETTVNELGAEHFG